MIEALRQFLPERSAEDALAERIRLSLGGVEYTLPVLTIERNEQWLEALSARLGSVLAGFDKVDRIALVLARLALVTPSLLELIDLYDHTEQLPPSEELRRTCTDVAVGRAFFAVVAAAHPLAAAALDILLSQPELMRVIFEEGAAAVTREEAASPGTSSSPPPPTAGRPKRSAAS